MASRVVVVCTAANDAQADAYRKEMDARRALGSLPPRCTLVLSVADPCGARIGSGGGTLNALVAVAEEFEASLVAEASSAQHGCGMGGSRCGWLGKKGAEADEEARSRAHFISE